ncbi:MAG: PIN domain-containing protein [Candidatus Hodarchaeales archaeon]
MNKILLDTTHILLFFSMQITLPNHKEQLKALLRIPSVELKIYISDLSLLEARWKLISLKRREKKEEKKTLYDERFMMGYNQLCTTREITILNWYSNRKAVEIAEFILSLGHSDYLDCAIIGAAHANESILVTEDKTIAKLVNQINNHREHDQILIMSWSQLVKKQLDGKRYQ